MLTVKCVNETLVCAQSIQTKAIEQQYFHVALLVFEHFLQSEIKFYLFF